MSNWPELKEIFTSAASRTHAHLNRRQRKQTLIQGISGSQKTLLITALWKETAESLILVTHSPSEAEKLCSDLTELIGSQEVVVLPPYDLLAHEEAYEKEVAGIRLSVLARLTKGERLLVITSWPALVRKVVSPEVLSSYFIQLELGGGINRDSLLKNLVDLGYERTEKVYALGQFSVRGDIVDVFPPNFETPVRIEDRKS